MNNVNIGGCQFLNSITSAICPINRGNGISCTQGELVVGNSGNVFWHDDYGCPVNAHNINNPPIIGNGCTFTGLQVGLVFTTSQSIQYSFVVMHSIFTNNLCGIQTTNSEKGKVIDCDFNGTRAGLNSLFSNSGGCSGQLYSSNFTRTDIEISGSKFYEVVECRFNFDDQNVRHIRLGINFEKFCRIIGNEFNNDPMLALDKNDNSLGISIEGDNNNLLSIQCNTFNEMGIDINIAPVSMVPDLGSTDHPAFNTFSKLATNRLRIQNDVSNGPVSYHFFNNVSFPRHNPLENSGRSTRVSSVAETTNETECSLTCEDFNLGINSIDNKIDYLIYPNPSTGIFHLMLREEFSSLNVRIFDINGVNVYSNIYDGENKLIEIDGNEFAKGIYIVRISDENGTAFSIKKLIIF